MKPELTQELVRNLFEYKDGFLYWKVKRQKIQIGKKAGSFNKSNEYYNIKINNKNYLTHRIIFLYHYSYLPKYIDHIDRNKLNNNIENLRPVTLSQNQWNKKPRKNTSSIYKGVSWQKTANKWKSEIRINNKPQYLGLFINEIDAALAYNKKAIELFGEYAYLNKVE